MKSKSYINGETFPIGRFNTVNNLGFPVWSIESVYLPSVSASYFVNISKLILKFIWKGKLPRTANTILKNEVGRQILTDLKTYYKATVIKTVWYSWNMK